MYAHDVPGVLWPFPVLEVGDKVEERLRVEMAGRGQLEEIVWIGQGLESLAKGRARRTREAWGQHGGRDTRGGTRARR